MTSTSYILNMSCPDTVGIVAAVAGFLSDQQYFIEESSHFGDVDTGVFFMRTQFCVPSCLDVGEFKAHFKTVAERFSMRWNCYSQSLQPKVIIMASKQDHCINDLLYRMRAGLLNMEVVAVVSNHCEVESVCQWYGIPFYHVPVSANKKSAAEAKLGQIYADTEAELIILARYMQILSAAFCHQYQGHIINIHHSFLPSFKGAEPYRRAYARGVKLIGATAHYVTDELDEGPIIEQMVERVSHVFSVSDLIAVGQDVERLTLSRAVQYHLQRRVMLNGLKTVVFH